MDLYKSCSTMTVELIDYIQQNPNTIYHMDRFLGRYQNAIFNFIRLTIGDYHDSADVTNKVLLTLSKKVKEIEKKKSFNRLALKIIKGEIGNYWKSQKTRKAKMLKQATIWHNDEQISLVETLEGNDNTAEEILSLLIIRDIVENSSDPHMKEIFWMKYRDNESITEIGNKLSLTEYQVKKCLYEIRRNVEKYLEES